MTVGTSLAVQRLVIPLLGTRTVSLVRKLRFPASHIHVSAKLLQSCLTLCNNADCNPQAPPSMGFSRQEYWSGLPCPPPGHLPEPGIEPASLMSPAWTGRFFTTAAKGTRVEHLTSDEGSFACIWISQSPPGGSQWYCFIIPIF